MQIKFFENFNDEDDLGLINVIGSKATISLSIGTKNEYQNIKKIPEIISDYKKMYIENDEWVGGPCNKEWLVKYHRFFDVPYNTAAHAWRPVVILTIHTNGFGIIKLGFSIRTKKCCTYDWSGIGKKDTKHPEYYEKSIKFLKKFIEQKIFKIGLNFDETIKFLDLELEPAEFDFDPIETQAINEEAGTGNNITYRYGKNKDYTQLRKIANQYRGEFGFIKRVAIEESIQKKELIVAEIDHVVVGFIHFYKRKDGINTVREIAVDKAYLELGIGKILYTMVPKPKKLSASVHNDKANNFSKKVNMNLLKTDKKKQRHTWSTLTESISAKEIENECNDMLLDLKDDGFDVKIEFYDKNDQFQASESIKLDIKNGYTKFTIDDIKYCTNRIDTYLLKQGYEQIGIKHNIFNKVIAYPSNGKLKYQFTKFYIKSINNPISISSRGINESEEVSSDDRELLKGIASKTELVKSLKRLSDRLKEIKDATDTPDKLISYSNFVNRKSKLSPTEDDINSGKKLTDIGQIGKDYFYDILDDGWKYYREGENYYTKITFHKAIEKSEAENEFKKLLKTLNDIKNKLGEIEGFNCHFMIWFNNQPQQEFNKETYKNDKYRFKGIGNDLSDSYNYIKYNRETEFLAKIEFVLI